MTSFRCLLIVSPCWLLSLSGPIRADTVYLKNGAWIDGIIRSKTDKILSLDIGTIGKIEIPTEEIHEIEKNALTGVERQKPADVLKNAPAPAGPADKEKKPGEEADAKEGKDPKSAEAAKASDKEDPAGKEDEAEASTKPSDPQPLRKAKPIAPELKKKIEQLVEDLKRQKPQFRTRAERHLRAIGEPSLSFLIPVATNESELTRIGVFRLFEEFGDETVVDACIQALLDSSEFVRENANKALLRITKENFGFQANASPRRREQAQQKWKKWWDKEKQELVEVEDLKKN